MRRIIAAFFALVLLLPSLAFGAADDIARLYNFTAGTTIQSSQVNGEFNQLVTTMNTKFGRGIANTLTGNNTFSGDNTFSGTNTFSNASTPIKTDKIVEYTSAAGVTIDGLLIKDGDIPGFIPAGTIFPYGGAAAPTGYLLCYGQAVSRTTYADLFTAVSTTFGSGDGSTTFNVPDLRGRVPLGKDNMGGSAASRVTSASTNGANSTTLGGVGGAETHTLQISEMPAHTHGVSTANDRASGGAGGSAGNGSAATSTSTGGGGAHSNTQPWMALNYIIKI